MFTASAGPATKTLPDTEALKAKPEVELSLFVDEADWEALVGEHFEIPDSYNEDSQDFMTRIRYIEHEELVNCSIEVLERDEEGNFKVRIQGNCWDVLDSDDEKPEALVKIEGWFVPQEAEIETE